MSKFCSAPIQRSSYTSFILRCDIFSPCDLIFPTIPIFVDDDDVNGTDDMVVMMMVRMMAVMITVMKVMTMMMMTLGNAPFSATAVQTNTTSSPQDFANIQIF